MKSYKAQTNSLLLAASLMLALMPVSALADKKDDLYDKGMKAVSAGHPIEARDAFCAIAKDDAEYKDAQKQCTDMTAAAKTQIDANNKRYVEAVQALQDGKLDEAENKFKLVRYGDRVQDAKNQLDKISKLKLERQNADAQTKNAADQANAINAKFEQGSAAFSSGNFVAARAALSGLTGTHAAEAQDILAKIDRYESLMQQAQVFANSKNFNAAASTYNQAGAISSNGPGNPFAKATEMTNQLASASNTPSNTAPPITGPTANKNPVTTANKDQIEKVDESKLVQNAKQLIARKKYPQARKLLDKVLAQNFKNPDALDLMKLLPQPAAQPLSSASAMDEDPVLAAAISKFYGANYDDAEAQLSFYVSQVGPKKPGLGNFYLGVSLLTRFYLSGESDQSLRMKAIRRFSDAKAVTGFKAPEKMVSPKILAVYNQAKGPATGATP
jgi:hypothetical protein